ncbi:MAG: phosphatidylglycerophosphatase A [Desulfovibrionaceae bacterium]|nr:phosphatidylglycerophosphatase A [Desulfovibrionaceae bacterium]
MNWRIKPELRALNPYNPWHIIALGFGSGLSPVAPGTAGSLAALPFCWLLALLPLPWALLAVFCAFWIGVVACQSVDDALGGHDHGAVVWDEFVGMFITTLGLPAHWGLLLAGFVCFRVFDVLKPWPIRWADRRIPGGYGIMLDDVLAGLGAWMTLRGLLLLFA